MSKNSNGKSYQFISALLLETPQIIENHIPNPKDEINGSHGFYHKKSDAIKIPKQHTGHKKKLSDLEVEADSFSPTPPGSFAELPSGIAMAIAAKNKDKENKR